MSPRRKRSVPRRSRAARQRTGRRCRFEPLESRQLLAVHVVEPMGQQYAWEDGHDAVFDLRTVFESDQDRPLSYELSGNTNETVARAAIESGILRIEPYENQHGEARITVRARESDPNQAISDTLTWHVRPVNDVPILRRGLPQLAIPEGGTATLDLTEYFHDVEQRAHELNYYAVPFDASDAGNPVAAATIVNGILSLQTTADVYGYAKYAISAVDSQFGRASATLYVFVEPVNDPPVARPLPDRLHRLTASGLAPLAVVDLWYQHLYDSRNQPYFHDVEDGPYLDFSVAVSHPQVFHTPPSVDANSFLVYRPTAATGFVGSAVVTITARDREGAVARLADGSLPSFTVRVDNSSMTAASSLTPVFPTPEPADPIIPPPDPWSPTPVFPTPDPSDPVIPPPDPYDPTPIFPTPLPPDPVYPLPLPPGSGDPVPAPPTPDPPSPTPIPSPPALPTPVPPDPVYPMPPVPPSPDPVIPVPGEPIVTPPGGSLPPPGYPYPPDPGIIQPVPIVPDPPGPPPPTPRVDLEVLGPRVSELYEDSLGAIVVLNNGFLERNRGVGTVHVGPEQRAVTVLTSVPDNQPDRGREHGVHLSWQLGWDSFSDEPWRGWAEATVRPARLVTNMSGFVQFDVPAGVRLWIPAWALYGAEAFTPRQQFGQLGARWITVRPGERYRLGNPEGSIWAIPMGNVLPLAIEGVAEGTGRIGARFAPTGVHVQLSDSAKVTVVNVDLDIDSDNDDGRGLPQRWVSEETLEDDWRHTGKRLVVNADDVDRDQVPDYLDGFDLDGYLNRADASAADDRTLPSHQVGFVPLVIELSQYIDPQRALLRFSYGAADPGAATIAADGRRDAQGRGIRLWTADESVPRHPSAADDPHAPGHYIAPYAPRGSGYTDPTRSDATYTVAQLAGDPLARRFTVYVEGISAGEYPITILVDPDGDPDSLSAGPGCGAPPCPDLFAGYLLRDTVRVTVESEVSVSATNAVGAETDDTSRSDVVQFEVRRRPHDTRGGLAVFYRLHTLDGHTTLASDPMVDPARADYYVARAVGSAADRGLVDDPHTQIGSVWIPDGSSSVVLTVVPRQDAAVEWDESVAIELIRWDEYCLLHDQSSRATPNDGLPSGMFVPGLSLYRSPYRLTSDSEGQVAGHVARAVLLDNDALVTRAATKPHAEELGVEALAISQGHVRVDVQGGHAELVLPLWGPVYRDNDHLQTILETVLQLPSDVPPLTRLTADCTVAGYSGDTVSFDVSALADYLDASPLRELRLVVVGPPALQHVLATGRTDADVAVTAYAGERAWTRTVRGSVDVINRVDDVLGTNEFGNRWSLDELDQVVPSDGISSSSGSAAASRLAPWGARTESGVLLVGGDNATTWFAAPDVARGARLEIQDSADGRVVFSHPADWIGNAGEGGAAYRTTNTGLHHRDASVTWRFESLEPDHLYQVYVHWDADPDLASNAVYQICAGDAESELVRTVVVDQRYVPGEHVVQGRAWRSLGYATPAADSTSIEVRLRTTEDGDHFVDGLLSAGAVMLVDRWEFQSPPSSTSTLVYQPESGVLQRTTQARDRYEFSAGSGLLLRSEDRNGNRVEYTYQDADGDGRHDELARIMRQGGLATTFHYTDGKLDKITDFAGRVTAWDIENGRVIAITAPDPGGGAIAPQFGFAYDPTDGLLTEVTSPRGYRSQIQRDALARRVARVTNPDGRIWSVIPFLIDGAADQLRLPATGRIGVRTDGVTPTIEAQATYVDPRGNTWFYQTDVFGQLTAEAQPPVAGSPRQDVWRWVRDSRGLLRRSILPPGGGGDTPLAAIVTRYEYDSVGNLRRRERSDGTYEEWIYEPLFQHVRNYRDAAGRRTAYDYDPRGNLILQTAYERQYADTADRSTRFEYTAAPSIISQLPGGLTTRVVVAADSPDAVMTDHEYFASGPHTGLLRAIHVAAGVSEFGVTATTQYTYDARRNPLTELDMRGGTTSYVYDHLDRLVRQTDPAPGTSDHGRPVTTYRYDTAGNVIEIIDPRGTRTVQAFDAMNRLTTTTLPAPGGSAATDQRSAVTRYQYDASGNVIRETDPLGRTVDYTYDARHQNVRIARSGPAPASRPAPPQPVVNPPYATAFQYDTLGNPRAMTDARGATTTYQYDASNRLTRETAPAPVTGQHVAPITYRTYDLAGQLVEERSGGGTEWRVTNYRYDDLGRLRTMLEPADGEGRRPSTEWTYDLRDNPTIEIRPDGARIQHHYDARDRLVRTTLPDPDGPGPLGQPISNWHYNADGTLRSLSQSDSLDAASVATFYAYDQLGRLIRETSPDPDGAGPGTPLVTTYRYDAASNVTSVVEQVHDQQTRTTAMQYDKLNRVWKTTELVAGEVVDEVIQAYDRAGQLVRRMERLLEPSGAVRYRSYDTSFDVLGRVILEAQPAPEPGAPRPVTYHYYDAVGNLICQRDAAGGWTQYLYDALNRLVTVTQPATEDHPAAVTRFEYTVAGDLRAVIDPLGRRTQYAYDNFGRELLKRGPLVDGRVPELWTRYDLLGQIISTLDSDGHATAIQYDALGRPITRTQDGTTSRSTYNRFGQLTSQTDASGAVTRYGYDRRGRQTVVLPPHPAGREVFAETQDDQQASLTGTWATDSGGLGGSFRYATASADSTATAIWSWSNLPSGATYEVLATWEADRRNTTGATFCLSESQGSATYSMTVNQQQFRADVVDDGQAWQRLGSLTIAGTTLHVSLQNSTSTGRLIADAVRVVEWAGGVSTTYDAWGNVLSQTDGLGNTTSFTYDAQSHRTSVIDAHGDTTRFRYDGSGRLATVIDPLGNATNYVYDDLDRVTHEWWEQAGTVYATAYQYDLRGHVVRCIDRRGTTRQFRYDAMGRLQEETWYQHREDAQYDRNRLNTIHHDYDAAGRLVAVADHASAYTFTYDVLDRQVATLVDLPGIPEVVLVSQFGRHDDLRSSTTAWIGGTQDFANQYTHDARGLLQRLEQAGPTVASKRIQFSYTAAGQFARLERFEQAGTWQSVVASTYTYDAQGKVTSLVHRQATDVLAGYHWRYDTAGRVLQAVSSQDGTVDYRYDAQGQLITTLPADQLETSYRYDANGNRAGGSMIVGARNQWESDGTYSYEYDSQGNRTKRTELATGAVTEYRWDPLNRLSEIVERLREGGPVRNSVAYAYDMFGRRVSKWLVPAVGPAEAEHFVYDGDHIVLRFSQGRLANRYLHGPLVDQILADEQLAADATQSALLWPLVDNLGTVRDLIDYDTDRRTARIANHLVYDAFGQLVEQSTAATDHLFGFTGRERDDESDLYYYRARYYDPQLGRFISEDPWGLAAGDTNLYRYVHNSPTNKVDPTGHYDQDVHFYMNYYLARYLGLDQSSGWLNSRGQPMSEALVIAYFCTRVDYDRDTMPMYGASDTRPRFHFPHPYNGPSVRERDVRVRQAVQDTSRWGSLEMFGILLHVYQDTFSHQGFYSRRGHLFAEESPFSPDEPYRYPDRSQRMAWATYREMERLLLARRGIDADDTEAVNTLLAGRSFDDFWQRIQATLLIERPFDTTKSFARVRAKAWQELIGDDFRGAAPRFTDTLPRTMSPMAERLRWLAQRVPEWYRPGYDHDSVWRHHVTVGHWRLQLLEQEQRASKFVAALRAAAIEKLPQRPTSIPDPKIEWYPPYGKPKW